MTAGPYSMFRWPRNWKAHVKLAVDRGYMGYDEVYTVPESVWIQDWYGRKRKIRRGKNMEKLLRAGWNVCSPPLDGADKPRHAVHW